MAAAGRLSVELAIRPPLTAADLPGLCRRVRRLLERHDPVVAFCDVGALTEVDAVTVDALARLQLAAHRHGCQVRLRHASAELRALVEFMGLADVLPHDALSPPSRPAGQER